MPTKVKWTLPEGFTIGDLEWQKPERFNDAGIVTYGYQDQTLIAATVTPPATLPPGKSIAINGKVKWLTCKEVCLPGGQDVSLSIAVANAATPENTEKFALVGFNGSPAVEQIAPLKGSILNASLHVEGASGKPMSL